MDNVHRAVSNKELDKLDSFLSDNSTQIQYSTAVFSSSGTKYRQIRYSCDDRSVTVAVLPVETTQEVTDEASLVDCYGIVYDNQRNVASVIPTDEYQDIDFLPDLRQSFHESESYYGREADYKYHFNDGSTEIAVRASDPVERLEQPLNITAVEYIGGQFPKKWLIETKDSGYMYLRERSGSIRLYDSVDSGEEIFNAYIGREHPGTSLRKKEVINIITSVNYIDIADDYDNEVPEHVHDEYWEGHREAFSSSEDYEEIIDSLDEALED